MSLDGLDGLSYFLVDHILDNNKWKSKDNTMLGQFQTYTDKTEKDVKIDIPNTHTRPLTFLILV